MTFLEAAIRILSEAEEPLTAGEITERALARELIQTDGKTADQTMSTQLYRASQEESWPRRAN